MTGRILLVEDDPDVRTTMEHTLFQEGYVVDVATTVVALPPLGYRKLRIATR